MTIYLLGVSHDYQSKSFSDFVAFITAACKEYGIRSIGEEMNDDALTDVGVSISVPKSVANDLGLHHAYCDPGNKERTILEILGDQEIEIMQWRSGFSAEHMAKLKDDNHRKRELIWLERIKQHLIGPVLYICGVDHLDSFRAILQTDGYDCHMLEKTFSSCRDKNIKYHKQPNNH